MPQLHIQTYEEHSAEQKKNLVRDLTKTVCAAADVAPKSVQVQFYEVTRANRAICGRLMDEVEDERALPVEERPWLLVQLQMFEGRTPDQKRRLAKGVTEDIERNFKIEPDRIQVIISEMAPMHNAIGGVLASDR